MKKRPWIFATNTFEASTRGSYINALTLSTHLDAALFAAKADAAILVLYNYYHPIHLAYVAAYNAWLAQGGTRISNTQTLNNLLAGLTIKIDDWDFQVQQVYRKKTDAYKAIFPYGHKPFLNGSQTSRIATVHALDTALTGIAPLAATKTDVDNYANALDAANTTQKGSKTITVADSTAVEAQRILMTTGQLYCYGGLLQRYPTQLDKIEQYFDMEILRTNTQTEFTGAVAPLESKNIVRRTLEVTQVLSMKNAGTTSLRFYLATQKDDAIGAVFIEVAPNSTAERTVNQLGNPNTQHFINVYNVDNNTAGEYELGIV